MEKILFTTLIATMLAAGMMSGRAETILPNDDMFIHSDNATFTNAYDGHVFSSQVVFGLAAANGVASGARRSYIEFTLGNDTASSAKLQLYNYWGANMGGGGNPAASGQIRLRTTPVGTPVTFTEPSTTLDTAFAFPAEAGFTSTLLTTAAGAITNVGWYEFDVTSWYNARLGQTTTLLVRGVQTGGFDFPIFEDRENSAFLNGSANTLLNSGPRLEIVPAPEPTSLLLLPLGGLVLLVARRRRA